jgi:hypothetical protein
VICHAKPWGLAVHAVTVRAVAIAINLARFGEILRPCSGCPR